jgi:hypothetical protein
MIANQGNHNSIITGEIDRLTYKPLVDEPLNLLRTDQKK